MEALGMIETKGLVAMIEAAGCDGQGRQRDADRLREDRRRACDRRSCAEMWLR